MDADTLVVIPARGGSKGIPHKNINIFNGKPLITYAIDCARAITLDNNICVSTDDDEIIEVVENYGMKKEVYVAVLDMQTVTMLTTFDRKYEGIAKFPSVTRDLALVVDKSVFVGEIEKVIKKCGGKMLESYKLFDVYEGAQVAPGKKSVAYSLVFRDKTKTLTDADVNPVVEKLLAELSKMGIEIRA